MLTTGFEARCFVEPPLDGDYKDEKWPRIFTTILAVGDCVESASGKVLAVTRIVHSQVVEKEDKVKDEITVHPVVKVFLGPILNP